MGIVYTRLVWDPDSGLRALSKRRDCVKAVLGMEGDTFLHRKTFSDYGRLKA